MPRLREQQEEHAVDDRQRLIESGIERRTPAGERDEHFGRRSENTVLQRAAHAGAVVVGFADQRLERAVEAPEDELKRRRRHWFVGNRVERELDEPRRVWAPGVEQAEGGAVVKDA